MRAGHQSFKTGLHTFGAGLRTCSASGASLTSLWGPWQRAKKSSWAGLATKRPKNAIWDYFPRWFLKAFRIGFLRGSQIGSQRDLDLELWGWCEGWAPHLLGWAPHLWDWAPQFRTRAPHFGGWAPHLRGSAPHLWVCLPRFSRRSKPGLRGSGAGLHTFGTGLRTFAPVGPH